jgi:hypothetical protein
MELVAVRSRRFGYIAWIRGSLGMSDKLRLTLIALSALAVRLAVAPFTGHPWDVYVWIKSAEMFRAGFWNVYRVSEIPSFPWGFYSYPPVWLFVVTAAYVAVGGLSAGLGALVLAIKAPIVAADLLVAYWIYRLAGLLGMVGRKRVLVFAAYALNPLPAFISGVWGMFDTIAVLFSLVGLELLIRQRPVAAGLVIGIGTATKVFPVLLFPLGLLWIRRTGPSTWKSGAVGFVTGAVAVPVAVSVPFLISDPSAYLEKLLMHTKNVGQFTYWTLLAPLTGTVAASVVSFIVFAIAYAFLLRKCSAEEPEPDSLVYYSTTVIGVFLATSVKVNVQYLLWFLPLALLVVLQGERRAWREIATAIVVLEAAAILFLFYANLVTPFSLDRLGVVVPPAVREESAMGLLLVLSALIAGWQLLRIGIAVIRPGLDRELISRFGISSMLLLLATSLVLMPSPRGVHLMCPRERIAVLEGPDALFNPDGSVDGALLERLGSPTAVVLPLSLDYFLLRREGLRPELNEHLLFRLGSREWGSGDLRRLAESLRSRGVKPLVGVFAYTGETLISYGIQGFTTELLESRYGTALKGRMIDFGAEVSGSLKLADLVAEGVARVVGEDGFEGVYVMTELYRADRRVVNNPSVTALLGAIRERLGDRTMLVFDGVDVFKLDGRMLEEVLKYADLVVVRASPWFRSFRSLRVETVGLQDVAEKVRAIYARYGNGKLAYAVYVESFAEGWIVPAIQVQAESDALGSVLGSCSVVFAGRYVPYRLSAPVQLSRP